MQYPVRLVPDVTESGEPAGFVVTFRDVPEAISQGDTVEEALEMAADALVTAMDFYLDDMRPIPQPSKPEDGEHFVELPADVVAKFG